MILLAHLLTLTATDAPAAAEHPPAFAVCAAPQPGVGERFSGFVLQVMSGDALCVATGPAPREWIRVRLAGVTPPPKRGVLMAASFAQKVSCVAVDRVEGEVFANCSVGGVALSQIIRWPAIRQAAAAWR